MPSKYVYYGLYLYFSGLSLRRTSERLSCYIQRNHVSVWNWIQRYRPQRIFIRSKKISEYIVDETLLKVGSEYIWLWIAIEPENKQILALSISKERNIYVCCGKVSFCLTLAMFMGSIQYQLMVVEHGIHKLADS